jgi:ammonium transporter, Amt family
MKSNRKLTNWLSLLLIAFVAVGALTTVRAGDPNPGGDKTGVAADAQDGTGASFVVSEPAALSADDAKDPAKVKAYEEAKKGFDEFTAQMKAAPLTAKLADAVGQTRISINLVWTLVTGFLVMFMQLGFALVETGLCRAKNACHTMFMNIFIYAIGVLGFWACGFALMYGAMPVGSLGGCGGLDVASEFTINLFGKPFGLFATKGFFLSNTVYDVGVFTIFLFQMVFMDTAATIPTGAFAERWSLKSFYVYGFFMAMLLYPVFGNWAWGGGWLSQLGLNFGLGHGYCDFAGSGVVHAVGGLCSLAGVMVLGPRIGKYRKDGSVNPIPAHHIPMAITGCLILAFGWFGFNPGSTLGAAGGGLNRIGIIATVTMLASAAGAFTAAIYMTMTTGKPDPTMVANGMLAGLVAITAGSGFVSGISGVIIGAIAGVLVCVSVKFFDKLQIDDPVGAISVHGVNGLWGVLAVGIFADGSSNYGGAWNGVSGSVRGILYGDASQLVAQLIGCVTLIVWAGGFSWVFFKLANLVVKMRVSPETELQGLDIPETGVLAYPDFQLSSSEMDRVGHAELHKRAEAPASMRVN